MTTLLWWNRKGHGIEAELSLSSITNNNRDTAFLQRGSFLRDTLGDPPRSTFSLSLDYTASLLALPYPFTLKHHVPSLEIMVGEGTTLPHHPINNPSKLLYDHCPL
jgi:hypothetical protein